MSPKSKGFLLTNKFCRKNTPWASKKSIMCVGKFHCDCLSIPVEKIHFIDVVVLRHTSYRAERFDNPSTSVDLPLI